MQYSDNPADEIEIKNFLNGRSEHTLALFHHFIKEYQNIGNVVLHPTKTMIALSNPDKRIAWITQLGKNFIHIVFPFKELYEDNLCFTKIGQVPDNATQFNHHLRIYQKEDFNEEVLSYMQLAYKE